jgi:hypothetical protein
MMLRCLLWSALLSAAATPLPADTVEDLGRVLRLDEMIDVMRAEGIAYGAELEGELFPGAGGARWQEMVDAIYDTGAMRDGFDRVFGPRLAAEPAALAQAVDFFASDRGQRIVTLEIEARRALLDGAVEDAARLRVEEMRREDDPRLELITRFVEVNDLIEQNVSGALNANLGFYRGLSAGGAFDAPMSDGEMLSEVWSQEAQVRSDAEDWVYPFLALAHEPLSDEDLRAYIVYSETASGQALNGAMFAAFDVVFTAISEQLGAAAARLMFGQDI